MSFAALYLIDELDYVEVFDCFINYLLSCCLNTLSSDLYYSVVCST